MNAQNNMKIIIGSLLLGIFALPCFGQDIAHLQTLLDTARQNNPEIKAAQKAYQSADQSITSMSGWSEPWVGVDAMKDNNRLYISQMFSFPGKLSYKKSAVTKMAQAFEQELKQKTLLLDTKVKKAFFGYWLAYKNIETFNENIRIMNRFLQTARSKYIVGKVTEADVLSATAELGRMKGMLVIAEYERDAMKSELNTLMNKLTDETLGEPENIQGIDTAIDYKKLEQKALNDNFGLLSRKYMYQSSVADSKLSKMQWLPDLMAEARLSDDSDKTTFMAAVQVPLYFWNKVSEVRSKVSRSQEAEQGLEAEKNSVRLSLKDMYLQFDKNTKLIKIYETDILPSAKQAVEISESGYKTGKVDFLYLLDMQKKYLDYETEYNKLTAESRMYYAELEMLAGGYLK